MHENFITVFVVNLQQTGCQLVVLAGNHDSVATLNESREILAFLNTTVIASAGYAPQLLHRRDGSPGAVLCPIPFLRPRDIITSQAGLSGSEKQQQLLHAIADYYQQQYQEACLLRGERNFAGYRDRALNYCRRQQKRCGTRHLYRYAGCLSGAAFPTSGFISH
ncbi:Nuclease sbcCD subunit D [Salmonella enterica subsp. arizonae]|uniref:Nuclease SbcCD subunit D n=1 Tax=Salmonella enterica subsp. arizonae TaxID=59203 RepID=A0A379TG97_SALER|nr:Nuclease sbcCD subunit D [Salmonella enterica subsp. arizonae]